MRFREDGFCIALRTTHNDITHNGLVNGLVNLNDITLVPKTCRVFIKRERRSLIGLPTNF